MMKSFKNYLAHQDHPSNLKKHANYPESPHSNYASPHSAAVRLSRGSGDTPGSPTFNQRSTFCRRSSKDATATDMKV